MTTHPEAIEAAIAAAGDAYCRETNEGTYDPAGIRAALEAALPFLVPQETQVSNDDDDDDELLHYGPGGCRGATRSAGPKSSDDEVARLQHNGPSREELLTALEELANAADDVGVRYFDTAKLQTATERARTLIAQADNAGKDR